MKNKRRLLGLTATASLLSLSAVLASCDKTKEYTVTFKNGSETFDTQVVKDGYNVPVPTKTPTSGDLEFNGWYKDEAKTQAFDFGSVITEDTTVYANWVNKYTVTFSTDGGSNVAAATVREGGNVAVPTAPTKAGYVFNGWYSDAALTTAFNFGSVITKNTTVYARWELAEYNVSLYISEGNLYREMGVLNGGLLGEFEAPTVAHKEFKGWFKDAACSAGQEFNLATDTVTGDLSLYAKWEDLMVVTFYDGTEVMDTLDVKEGGLINNYADPRVPYKTFLGWYTDPSLEDDYIFNKDADPIYENTALYVKWEVKTEPVTFEFLASDFKDAGTVNSEGWSSGCFSAGEGSEFRTESGKKYTIDGKEISYSHGLKLNGEKSYFGINAATPGTITVIMADRGSLSKVKLVDPDGVEKTLTLDVNSATKMAALDINVTKVGEYRIYLATSGGTPDICNAFYATTVNQSAPESLTLTGMKTQFLAGADFDKGGLSVVLNYENGRKVGLKPAEVTVNSSAFDTTTPGTYTISVSTKVTDSEGEHTIVKTYDVEVLALDEIELGFNKAAKGSQTVTGGNGTYVNKTVSQVIAKGGTVDLTALTVKAISTNEAFYELYNKDTKFAAQNSKVEIVNIDSTTAGQKTVTVKLTMNGIEKTATFTVDVTETAPVLNNGVISLYVDPAFTGVAGAATTVEGKQYNTFKTIQQALDYLAIQKNIDETAKVIELKQGTYNEKLEITVPNLTIKGAATQADAAKYVIEWDSLLGVADESGFVNVTDSTQTVAVRETATNCVIQGITISNKYNNIGAYKDVIANGGDVTSSGERALALLVQADKFVMEDGRLLGWQDTLETFTGRQLFKNCYIQGAVDYIFGTNSATYFDGCTINTIKSKLTSKAGSAAAYVTAYKGYSGTEGTDINYGAVFNDCDFTVADDFVGYVCVGRNWGNYTSVTIMNSKFSNKFATKASETINGTLSAKNDVATLKYRFYNNTMNGQAFDFEEDIVKNAETGEKYNHKLSQAEAEAITIYEVFAPVNGKVKFDDAWGGLNTKDATIVLKGVDGTVLSNLSNVTYVGSYFTESQFKELYTVPEGQVLEGLFTDAACTTEYAFTSKVADAETVIYVKFAAALTMAAQTVTSDDITIPASGEAQWGKAPVYLKKTGSSAWSTDDNNKTIVKYDGSSYSTTKRVKSNCGNNTIVVDLSNYGGRIAVTVFAQTGSGSDLTRYISVKADGSTTELYKSLLSENKVLAFTYYLDGGSKYNLVTSAAINFYGVTLENVEYNKTWDNTINLGTDSAGAAIAKAEGNVLYADGLLIDAKTGWYEKQENLTEFASGKTYYTYSESSDKYTAVDQTTVTTPASGTEYYLHKNGKFAKRDSDIQFNKGTTVTFKVKAKSTVYVGAAHTTLTYQINGGDAVAFTNKNTAFTVEQDSVVTLTATGNTYLYKMVIAAPGTVAQTKTFVLGSNNTNLPSDYKVEAAVAMLDELFINAMTGKFSVNGGDNVQFNNGTKIQFYVNKGATVSVTGYDGLFAYKLNGTEATSAVSEFTATEDNTLITIEGTADSKYLKEIKVSYPQAQPETKTTVLTFEGLDKSKMKFDSNSKLSEEYVVAATDTTPSYTLTIGIKVEPTQKYYQIDDEDPTKKEEDSNYLGAINTQGNKKGIKIELKKGAKVKVYFTASGDNNDRYVVLYKVDGSSITAAVNGTVVANKGTGEVVIDTLTVTEDGTYIIGTSNGLRFAKIEITQ